MGHWHLNSKDIEANRKIFVAMGGTSPTRPGIQRVIFPGVVINLNPGQAGPPPTAGSVGSVVNHVGFVVQSEWAAMYVQLDRPARPARAESDTSRSSASAIFFAETFVSTSLC
jgi:hypothetical protein